ncbi:MAG: hypothetical protein ACK4TA_06070 [Saprospiraceae bacterium]
MSKIQVQAEVDVQSLLAQMDTDELEGLVREASALLTQRKSDRNKSQVTQLLQQLNEECALPEAHWQAFHALLQKRATQTLSEADQAQLDALIQEEEKLRLKRIQILGELAEIKGISIQQMAAELGIHPTD